jgi:hypothetical protein
MRRALKDIKLTFLVPSVARADIMITANGCGYYAFDTEDSAEHADIHINSFNTIADKIANINIDSGSNLNNVSSPLQGAIWIDDERIGWESLDDNVVNEVIYTLLHHDDYFEFLRGFLA